MYSEKYDRGQLLRRSYLWNIFKGKCKSTGQPVAIKRMMKMRLTEEAIGEIRRRIEIHRNLKHENIIEVLESFENKDGFWVVTEFPQGKELSEVLADGNGLPEEQIHPILRQLVSALNYLHSNGIIHGNLEPVYIHICAAGSVVKLWEFGFTRFMYPIFEGEEPMKGIPLYMAPEVFHDQVCSRASDLWSLGVILYELFADRPPFRTETQYALLVHIIKGSIEYKDSMSTDLKIFLSGLLNKDPQKRFNWLDLLEHPFVKGTKELKAKDMLTSIEDCSVVTLNPSVEEAKHEWPLEKSLSC